MRRPRSSSQAAIGREDAADRAAHPVEALAQRRIARRDDAGEHVGVSGQVLRRALPGEVGAEVERALQERRRERAVAAQQRPSGVRVARGLGDVGQREQRVRRRLDDRERRAVAGAAEALGVAHVIAAQLHAEALEDPRREALEAVVAARRQRQRRSLSEHRQADARPGRHAAREDGRLGVLERAQQGLRLDRHGRVPAPVGRRCRPGRGRRSSSGRAQARARATGCRRDRARAASRAPCRAAFQAARRRAPRAGQPARRLESANMPASAAQLRRPIANRARHRPGSPSPRRARIVATSR